jgi:CRP-like cAMP-binding protein
MRGLARWSLLLLLPLAGCIHSTGVEPRRFLMDKAMKNEVERRELFEATLLVLDEHPEYVDQLFRMLLEHRSSLNRFLAINASGLDDPQYAALMARHLVRHPEPLTVMMIQALEAAKDNPEAQRAMALAMEQRAALTAQTYISRPSNVTISSMALIDVLQGAPEARQAYLTAMRERREQVAALLLSDPETLSAVMGAMAKQGVEDSSVARQLRSLVEGLTPGHGGSGQEQGDKDSKPKKE